MPEMIPVGNAIQPPNPMQGLNMLSSLYGLQQQKLALQTGQAQLQTAQATAQQEQQTATQRQGIANYLSKYDPEKHMDSDGTIDVNGALEDPELRAAAGDMFPQVAQGLLKVKMDQITAKQGLAGLNGTLRGQFNSAVGSVVNDPDVAAGNEVGFAKVRQAIHDWEDSGGPDALRVGQLYENQLLGVHPDRLQSSIRHVQLQAEDANTQATQQKPEYSSVAVGTPKGGTENRTYQTNPYGPNPQAIPGTLPVGLPPQVVQPPGGGPQTVAGGQAGTGSVGGPVGGGPAPSAQDWENSGTYIANLNARVQTASDSIPRIQQAEAALDQIRSGHGSAGYAALGQILQAVGAPPSLVDSVANGSLAASQEAEKYLFQTTFSGLRQSMQGDPARVAEFQSAEKIFPSIGTDPRAAKNVLNFMVQQGQRDYAEQQALLKARSNNTFNPVTWQAQYQQQLRAGKVPGVPASQVPASQNPANAAPAEGTRKTGARTGRPMILRNGRWEYND
jgi:hypothetical protein